MAKLLVTVLFWLSFGLTVPFIYLGALFLTALKRDPHRRGVHAFVCACTFGYFRLNPGWRIAVEGRERLPEGPAVLVANHQSMADIVAVMGLSHPFKFVSKASLFALPIVGWTMSLARYVAVERGKPASTRQMLEDCRSWLRKGVPVLLFPEGTYSEDGRLLPFKRGAFRLAIDEKVPLVPVLIRGTRELVDGDGPLLNPTCRMSVEVLPPIPPDQQGGDDGALTERVRELFVKALERRVTDG